MSGEFSVPKYGEVWLIRVSHDHDDSFSRPGVVVSSDALRGMPWKLVALIDNRNGTEPIWRVELPEIVESGTAAGSVVDAMQLHCVDLARCLRKLGHLPADCMTEIAAAIAIVVEYGS